ncbi:MAG: 2-oxoglutarate dehydrogenase complex dihydrolipoyllysine-residue succinyltransferase [Acidobacteriota bacterium]
MAIELKVPDVGESITEVMVGEWLKKEGEFASKGEALVIIETDKVNAELEAPESGVVQKIVKGDGEDAEVGEVIGFLEPGESAGAGEAQAAAEPAVDPAAADQDEAPSAAAPADTAAAGSTGEARVMPAASRLAAQEGVDVAAVAASGPGGRVLKEDVQRHVAQGASAPSEAAKPAPPAEPAPAPQAPESRGARETETVKMTPLRRRVASRLVEAQQSAALLTTFNEIDMSAVLELRRSYKQEFIDRHEVKLGFMSFFVKATVEALKAVPQVNAQVRGEEIVYHNYFDIGVAVGGGKGLVVPVIRNAERLGFADVEKVIGDYARRAQAGTLKLDELQGGTFTISNGGVYGSLMSTPIINPPQSGILGLHKIQERPMAIDGEVVIRPMMYVALTYDHRIVDGREAVTFLIKIKERIEDPTRILLEV